MLDTKKVLDLFQNKKTVYEIAQIMGISKREVFKIIDDNNLTLPPRDKKYRLLKAVPLTLEQRELITGCLMGLGALIPHDNGQRFTCGHLDEDFDLLLWKKSVLANVVNLTTKHNKQPASFFRTVVHSELNNFRKLFYDNNKKVLPENLAIYVTPLTLAAWASDTAWVSNTFSIRFKTSNYSYEEHITLKSMLKGFGINSKICEFEKHGIKYFFLQLNKRNSILFYDLIKEYYPKPLRDFPYPSQRLYA